MSSADVELIHRAFAAWDRDDLEWLVRHTDPEVEITQPPDLPGSNTYRGLDGMREALGDWPSQWEDFRMRLLEVIPAGRGRVVAVTLQSGRGRESGLEVEAEFAFLLTTDAGKLTRWQMFTTRASAFEAAGLGDPADSPPG